jgi:hypothetical protein
MTDPISQGFALGFRVARLQRFRVACRKHENLGVSAPRGADRAAELHTVSFSPEGAVTRELMVQPRE